MKSCVKSSGASLHPLSRKAKQLKRCQSRVQTRKGEDKQRELQRDRVVAKICWFRAQYLYKSLEEKAPQHRPIAIRDIHEMMAKYIQRNKHLISDDINDRESNAAKLQVLNDTQAYTNGTGKCALRV